MSTKLSNQGLSSIEEFIKYIKLIGFKRNGLYLYYYEEFKIFLYHDDYYNFYNGSKWIDDIPYTDLKPLEKCFNRELRSIKLKQLLR